MRPRSRPAANVRAKLKVRAGDTVRTRRGPGNRWFYGTVERVERSGLICMAADVDRNSGGPAKVTMPMEDAQWLFEAGNLEVDRAIDERAVERAVKAVEALRHARNQLRAKESNRVFGHTGAAVPAPIEGHPEYGDGCPPSLVEEVRAVLAAVTAKP